MVGEVRHQFVTDAKDHFQRLLLAVTCSKEGFNLVTAHRSARLHQFDVKSPSEMI